MKVLKLMLLASAFLLAIFLFMGIRPNEKPFVVVIPSYNNKTWYEKNLASVFAQKYHNYRVVYIDDASPDETGGLVQDYIEKQQQQSRVTLIRNDKRKGSLANLYAAIHTLRPDEIVVDLDGDDWLYDENVLNKLNQLYQDPHVWVTYGQFVYQDGEPGWAAELPKEVIEQNNIREYEWVTTHLRTFYAGLFQKIKAEDLQQMGEFFPMAGDLAFMYPILEMAGSHSRFISDILYVYNFTKFNDSLVDPTYQAHLGLNISMRSKYLPVAKPF